MQLPFVGKVKNPTGWIVGLTAASILTIGSTSYLIMNRATPKVDLEKFTVPVVSQSLAVRITASGTVIPIKSVNLSPKSAGRLQRLLVDQGDKVQKGQIIAYMDNRQIQAEVRQAKANWEQAKARQAEAERGSRREEIAQAQARLKQAQARLAQAKTGRPEEIAQAQAELEDVQGQVNRTEQRLRSYQSLVEQGAITRDEFNLVKTENITAQARLKQAQERLQQVRKGGRIEEIAQLEAAVNESRAALAQLQNGQRPEQIQQLRAASEAAQAQFLAAQVQLDDTEIRAPFSGIVTQKYASEGAFVTPTTSASSTNSATSTSVVALAQDLEIKARVPEVDVGRIKPGQQAEIVADAYPDKIFKGSVRLVAPEAVLEQNVTSFEVRVRINTGKEQLRSGMNVNVTFLGDQLPNALVVPTVAIVTEKGKTGVMLPNQNNQPVFQEVKIGSSIEDKTQILSGIKAGDRVFIDIPNNVKPITNQSNNDQNRAVRMGARRMGVRTRP